MAASASSGWRRVLRRTAAGTAAVLMPSCGYVAYTYRPRASFDIDYHESLVREKD